MRAFIQSAANGFPHTDNFFDAYQGFHEMGFETIFFRTREELLLSNPEDVVVGYVGTVQSRLRSFGVEIPDLDYPEELTQYLRRRIWPSKLNYINSHPDLWPVFVKPVKDKAFTGVAVRSTKDLVGCGNCMEDYDVLCSDILDIRAEWRVFVRYGNILDVRPYRVDWRLHYNPDIIESAVNEYVTAPAGYAIDFGVTADGKTVLIEVNDGYALGNYGLFRILYAQLLSARWAELTGTKDECRF